MIEVRKMKRFCSNLLQLGHAKAVDAPVLLNAGVADQPGFSTRSQSAVYLSLSGLRTYTISEDTTRRHARPSKRHTEHPKAARCTE
jgi:hypothetical protein